MSEREDQKSLRVGQYGYSLDIIEVGKRGFCYFDGERYKVKAGVSIRKWSEVIVITLVPEPTVIETWTVFPLSYELAAGGLQSVGELNPLPVIEDGLRTITESSSRKTEMIMQRFSRSPTGVPIFHDGFDYPLTSYDGAAAVNGALGWTANGDGSIARNTTYKFAGTGSLGVTSPAPAYSTQRAWKNIPVPIETKIGVEFYMAGQSYAEGFNKWDVGLRYESVDAGVKDWYLFNIVSGSGARYVTSLSEDVLMREFPLVYDCTIFTTHVDWHHLKFVVDLARREFISLQIDNIVKNMTGISPFKVGSPSARNRLTVQLGFQNADAGGVCLTLFDELTVTTEES